MKHMENKQLTLEEKWQADIESYKRCGGMKVTTPQCKKCKYWIKANALNCMKYEKSKKPSYVLSAAKECPEFESADKIAISIKSDTESRLKGGLWGAITADALGVPVELSTEYQPTFKVFERILNGKIDSEKEKNI